MQRKKNPNKKSRARRGNPTEKVPRLLFGGPAPGVRNRQNNVHLSATLYPPLNLVNATALNPFDYAYVNLTNPIIWMNGSATPCPYFTGYKTLWRKFRVRRFRVSVTFFNAEATAVQAAVTLFNFLPPNTLANNEAALANAGNCRDYVSPQGGMDRVTLVTSGSVASMSGFSSTNVEDAYVGLTSGLSNPTDNIYASIVAYTGGIAAIIGVLIDVTVDFWVDFIEKETVLN